jgi:hypothetical protein
MRNRILGCVAVLALAGGGFDWVAEADDKAPQPCCFTNERYAGVCSVEPAEGETCATILAYLNNPQSQGKSYCSNTDIRGGWQQKRCLKPASDAAQRTQRKPMWSEPVVTSPLPRVPTM